MSIPHVIFSYPGEYARFVEYCAAILKRYLGNDMVFHYTDGSRKLRLDEFAGKLQEWTTHEELVYMVVLTYNDLLVQAQQNEMEVWEQLNNVRGPAAKSLHTLFVNMPTATRSNPKDGEPDERPPRKAGRRKDAAPKQISTLLVSRLPFDPNPYVGVRDVDRASAERLAEYLLRHAFELPEARPSSKAFTYEKQIIDFYSKLFDATKPDATPFVSLPSKDKKVFMKCFAEGVPMVWPSIRTRTDFRLRENPRLEEIGTPRQGINALLSGADGPDVTEKASLEPQWVSVSALAIPEHSELRFLEAGPRRRVGKFKQVGIVVSGGIAPGINAVIDGIVQRHLHYDKDCIIHGFRNGFFGLAQNQPTFAHLLPEREDFVRKEPVEVTSEHVSSGGSVIGTFRLERLDDVIGRLHAGEANATVFENIAHNLRNYDALYVIGGDGSMKMANMLCAELQGSQPNLSIVGIPKTMDNDILWIWQSFGFATAVEKAREIIDCLSVEKSSYPGVCIVQLFGSVSGFVVSHSVLASQSGQCDAALIPEAEFSIESLYDRILKRMRSHEYRGLPPDGLIVMAETAIPTDWHKYARGAGLTAAERKSVEAFKKIRAPDYLEGKTSDALRSAGLKLLQKGLETKLTATFGDVVRVFTNEPRHILRATNPSVSDIIFGQRLGALAVDNALAGYSDFMISQWLTEYVLVPLRLVSIGRKRIQQDGIFWKSVLAKTKQDEKG